MAQEVEMVNGLSIIKEDNKVCTICNIGKQQRGTFPKRRQVESVRKVRVDPCGSL